MQAVLDMMAGMFYEGFPAPPTEPGEQTRRVVISTFDMDVDGCQVAYHNCRVPDSLVGMLEGIRANLERTQTNRDRKAYLTGQESLVQEMIVAFAVLQGQMPGIDSDTATILDDTDVFNLDRKLVAMGGHEFYWWDTQGYYAEMFSRATSI